MEQVKFPKLIIATEWEGYALDEVRAYFRAMKPSRILAWDNFFNGQTGGIEKGVLCVYKWDFDKFCNLHGILYAK